jgi:hypothetical protein
MDNKELFITVALISLLAVLIIICGLVIVLSICDLGDLMSLHYILAYKVGVIIGQVFKILGMIWIISYTKKKIRKHMRLIKA